VVGWCGPGICNTKVRVSNLLQYSYFLNFFTILPNFTKTLGPFFFVLNALAPCFVLPLLIFYQPPNPLLIFCSSSSSSFAHGRTTHHGTTEALTCCSPPPIRHCSCGRQLLRRSGGSASPPLAHHHHNHKSFKGKSKISNLFSNCKCLI